MIRKICYVTGTRADFGLMRDTLIAVRDMPELELSIVATGMHLSEKYGNTLADIEAAGLPVSAVVEIDFGDATGATMARNLGHMLVGFVDALERLKPDLVLVLGDRGEMLAAALAAVHLNIPVAHIHGGERSGTVDEPIRHAISKLAHFHMVATIDARERLIRMGERAADVYVTGAPGLDGIAALVVCSRQELMLEAGLDSSRLVALMVYHPVLQEAQTAIAGAAAILDALQTRGIQIVALKPNSDAGSDGIRALLEARRHEPDLRVVTHFPRASFVSWMATADLMIGNSSAGIIEAASFGTPVVNIGSRQNLRERNANVIDAPVDASAISVAVDQALASGRFEVRNVYGDGQAVARIVSLLRNLSLDSSILAKSNAY
jgi:GDP/UDP-N,N'-diacetylbacillosamine 2-epimerase (hydrolysing)